MGQVFSVVLIRPQIPPNTGNVARLCAATHTRLHLVRPLGFRLDSQQVRRAGLDYWDDVDLSVHAGWEEFAAATEGLRLHLFSKKGTRIYSDVSYKPGDFLVFGSETDGLPEDLLERHRESTVRLPILNPNVRSLNLADSVAVALYEALRQNDFRATE